MELRQPLSLIGSCSVHGCKVSLLTLTHMLTFALRQPAYPVHNMIQNLILPYQIKTKLSTQFMIRACLYLQFAP